jgi:hypothetical protein
MKPNVSILHCFSIVDMYSVFASVVSTYTDSQIGQWLVYIYMEIFMVEKWWCSQ